jgi:hypothetical protein
MEHGSNTDNSKSSFCLVDEDHTLANAVRFTLNQESALSDFSFKKIFILHDYVLILFDVSALFTFTVN